MKTLLVAVLLLAVLGIGGTILMLIVTTGSDSPAPNQGESVGEDVGTEPVPAPVEMRVSEGGLFRVDPNAVPREDRIELPDGTWVPTLNGTKDAPKLSWPSDHPMTPIVGKIFGKDGQEFYIHEDKTTWTTSMQWRKDINGYGSQTTLNIPATGATRLEDIPGPVVNPGR